MSDAVTREETLLNVIATGETIDIVPITRKEKYLRYLAGIGEKPSKPITREEMFLDKIQAGGSGGGGGEDEASVLDSLIDGSLTEITSNATSVRRYAFYTYTSLTTVDFPLATSIGNNSFYDCSSLTTVDFPLATIINTNAFCDCSRLITVDFPSVWNIGTTAFKYCTRLTTVDFSAVTTIGSSAFAGCTSLITVILRSEILCSLNKVNAFENCYHFHGTVDETYNPDGLKDGYIYVPKALIEDYKVATNWSNFATQFRALEDYTVDGTITGELDESKI